VRSPTKQSTAPEADLTGVAVESDLLEVDVRGGMLHGTQHFLGEHVAGRVGGEERIRIRGSDDRIEALERIVREQGLHMQHANETMRQMREEFMQVCIFVRVSVLMRKFIQAV